MLRAERGTRSWALRVRCTRQRCQAAPRSCSSIALTRPAWSSEMTRRTPWRPRSTSERTKRGQALPSSLPLLSSRPSTRRSPVQRDPGRDQGRHRDHPAALADLQPTGRLPHSVLGRGAVAATRASSCGLRSRARLAPTCLNVPDSSRPTCRTPSARLGCHVLPGASRRAALSAVEAVRDMPGSRLRIIQTLAIANQATQVNWAMYVIQPLAE